ncbi:MFS transporter [Chloroflexota bacterium]
MIVEKKPKIFSGYIVVVAAFLIMVIIHGIFCTFGVFFTPMLTEFGWSRAMLSGANSVGFITMGLLAIIMGSLSDKLGPRVVMAASGILFGAGNLMLAQTNAIWQLYLFWVVIGIGLGASDVVPLATIARWFIKRRGTMSGIAKVGTGLGMMAVPLIAGSLIAHFGWRDSYTILGILVLVSIIPLSLLLKRDPYQAGQLPDGRRMLANEITDIREEGLSLGKALTTRQLWIVFGMYFAAQFCVQTMLVHSVPYAVDLGASLTKASGVIATIGGFSMLGRLVMGFASDRIGNKRAMILCFITLAIALSWLQFAEEMWMLYLFAAVHGFSHGGFFALLSPTVAVLFGTRSQGVLLGIVIFGGTCGGALGPYLTGAIFDTNGSYGLAFLLLLIVSIIGLILALSIKPIRLR